MTKRFEDMIDDRSKELKQKQNEYIQEIQQALTKIGVQHNVKENIDPIKQPYRMLKIYYAAPQKDPKKEKVASASASASASDTDIYELSKKLYFGIFDQLGWEFKIDEVINEDIKNKTKTNTNTNTNSKENDGVDINALSDDVRYALLEVLNEPNFKNAKKYADQVFDYIRKLKTFANYYGKDFKDLCNKEIESQKQALNDVLALVKADKLGVENKNDITKAICESADRAFGRYIDSQFRKALGTGFHDKGEITKRILSTFGRGEYADYDKFELPDSVSMLMSQLAYWTVNSNYLEAKFTNNDIPNSIPGRLQLLDKIIVEIRKKQKTYKPSSDQVYDLEQLIQYFEKTKQKVEKEWAVYHTPGRSHCGAYGIVNPRIFLDVQEVCERNEDEENGSKSSDNFSDTSKQDGLNIQQDANSSIRARTFSFDESASISNSVIKAHRVENQIQIKEMEKRFNNKLDALYERTKKVLKKNIKKIKSLTGNEGRVENFFRIFSRPDSANSSITTAYKKLCEEIGLVNNSKLGAIEGSLKYISICNAFIMAHKDELEYKELINFVEHARRLFVNVINCNREALNFLNPSLLVNQRNQLISNDDHESKSNEKSLEYDDIKLEDSASDSKSFSQIENDYQILSQLDNYEIQKWAKGELDSSYRKLVDLIFTPDEYKNLFLTDLNKITCCKTTKDYADLLSDFLKKIQDYSKINTFWSRHYRDILVEVCCQIVETHYLKNIHETQLGFSEEQLKSAKEILELVSPYLKHNRRHTSRYANNHESIQALVRRLENRIERKVKDPDDVTRLMVYTEPKKSTTNTNTSDGFVSVENEKKLEYFTQKLNEFITANTLAEYVIGTGRLTTETSNHATAATGFLGLAGGLGLPAVSVIEKTVIVSDQLNNEHTAREVIEIMGDFDGWRAFIKEKLIPAISEMFKHIIMEMASEEDIKSFAEFCQKRMFNAIRSRDIGKLSDDKLVDSLISSIYKEKYDDLFDSWNLFYGRYRKIGDVKTIASSTFQEMLANAPIVTGEKENLKIYLDPNAIKADKVTNHDASVSKKMRFPVYKPVCIRHLPNLLNSAPKKEGEVRINTKTGYSFGEGNHGSYIFFKPTKEDNKAVSKKSNYRVLDGSDKNNHKTLAQYVGEQLVDAKMLPSKPVITIQ